ncbi:uncharacterized protein LAJ45_04781 [Morchella importuna]|uniref:uncharacterized protein n=1 Tax=Morchella importuna TaxID=1174673 RepID=UPI001E8E37C9|nr:uncharacterized protein LAJ45_04781 [Morchella importuna]KAH8151079.1 hypothetical protein LAJ45_04781 [Morchella importuna]
MPSIESHDLFPAGMQAGNRFYQPPTPPLGPLEEDIVEKYISIILSLYAELASFRDLDPAPQVNAAFGKLVGLCAEMLKEEVAEKIVNDHRIVKITAHLREICSQGECKLEAYWATKLSSEKDVNAELLKFPYYTNYVDLTRMEIYAMISMLPTMPRKFAFIGSGPLPLTSLCLADILEKELHSDSKVPLLVHNIDRDASAIELSSSLCQKLGKRARSMTFQCTEAMEDQKKQDLTQFDVVYLAALVGANKSQKTEIIADVAGRMRAGALLVMRSAHSLRSLLYPVVDPGTDLEKGLLETLLVSHPYNHIVNSLVISRVKAPIDGTI